jgi:translation initiation factor 2 beta subunit (eIF-2beta)/eIF-5
MTVIRFTKRSVMETAQQQKSIILENIFINELISRKIIAHVSHYKR